MKLWRVICGWKELSYTLIWSKSENINDFPFVSDILSGVFHSLLWYTFNSNISDGVLSIVLSYLWRLLIILIRKQQGRTGWRCFLLPCCPCSSAYSHPGRRLSLEHCVQLLRLQRNSLVYIEILFIPIVSCLSVGFEGCTNIQCLGFAIHHNILLFNSFFFHFSTKCNVW